MYEFTYQISEQDYLDYNLYHMDNAPEMKNRLLLYRLLVPVFFIAWIIVTYNPEQNFLVKIIFFTAVSVIWWFAIKPILVSSVKKQIQKLVKKGNFSTAHVGTLRFDADMIHVEGGGKTYTVEYAKVERVAVGPSAVYIYVNGALTCILPFSAFASEGERDEVLQFVNNKITENKADRTMEEDKQ